MRMYVRIIRRKYSNLTSVHFFDILSLGVGYIGASSFCSGRPFFMLNFKYLNFSKAKTVDIDYRFHGL